MRFMAGVMLPLSFALLPVAVAQTLQQPSQATSATDTDSSPPLNTTSADLPLLDRARIHGSRGQASSHADADDLDRNRNDLNRVLRQMPGVFTREVSGQPGIAVNIRGFEGYGRVMSMIDGVPQTFRNVAGHASSGGTLLYVDPNLLAGVDVERGAVSGAHGLGALAGAAKLLLS